MKQSTENRWYAGVSWRFRANTQKLEKDGVVPPIRLGNGLVAAFVGARGEFLCSPHKIVPLS